MIIGVTGSNGFIGRYLTARLRRDGNIVLDLDPWLRRDERIPDKYRTVQVVVHLAARTRASSEPGEQRELYLNNLQTTSWVCREAEDCGAKVVFASTYLYGNSKWPPVCVDEQSEVIAASAYARSKYESEIKLQTFSSLAGLPSVALRIFNVYGPGQTEDFVIPKIIGLMMRQSELTLQNLDSSRDFIFIDDVIDLISCCLATNIVGHKVLNCGSGVSTKILELINVIALELQTEAKIVPDIESKPAEISHSFVADTRRAHELVGWQPRVSLREGVRTTIKAQLGR